jgi:hypothetical protein
MTAIQDAQKIVTDFIAVADAIPPCISSARTTAEAETLQRAVATLFADTTSILFDNPQFTAVASFFGVPTSMASLQNNAKNLLTAIQENPTPGTLTQAEASALTGVISDLAGLAQGVAEIAEIPAVGTADPAAVVSLGGFAAACAAVKLAATGTQFAIDALSQGFFAAVDQGNSTGPVSNFAASVAWDIDANAGYMVSVPPLSGGNLSATITNSGSGSVSLSQSPNQKLVADISGNIGGSTGPAMAYLGGANVTVESDASGTLRASQDTISVGSSAQIVVDGYNNAITAGNEDSITATLSKITLPSDDFITLTGSNLGVYGANSSGANLTLPLQNYTNATVVNTGDGGLVAYVQNPSASGTISVNGTAIPVAGLGVGITIQNIAYDSGVSPDQVIADLATLLGDPLTAAQWDQDYINYLNPTGTTYTVSGTGSGSTETFTIGSSAAPGASVTGVSGKTNILDVAGDIVQDSISDIQTMDMTGAVTLTSAEWSEFSSVTGSGSLTFASAGSYSAASIAATVSALTAEDWGGTALTGNNTNNQILTASLFGNDTLTAGNGTADRLYAGEGVDTLTGGTGGDTFEAANGLASGSSITGHGTGNTLNAYGDISGATVTGVQTLDIASAITINATELAEFTAISDGGFSFTLNANGAGSYSLASYTLGGTSLTINADATDSQNLTGNNQNENSIIADGSSGNDALTVGNGSDDYLSAQNSFGNNSLTAGTGTDTLTVNGSSGNNTLTVGNNTSGYADDLYAQNSSGNNTFNAGSGLNVMDATGSTGINTFNGGSGSDTMIAGLGVSIMNGSSAGGTVFDVADGLETGSSITGHGTGNVLNASGDISGATLSGVQTLDISGDVTLTAAQLASVSTLDVTGTGATVTVSGAGTYSFSVYNADDLAVVADPTASVTLIAGSYVGPLDADNTSGNDTLELESSSGGVTASARYSSGNDTLTASSGLSNILDATGSTGTDTLSSTANSTIFYAGLGDDTLNGNAGIGDKFYFTGRAGAGTTVTGGSGGSNYLYAETNDISRATVTNVGELYDTSSTLTLTGAEFNEFTTMANESGTTATLVIVGSGSYSLSGKTLEGPYGFNLITDSGSTITGNSSNGQVLYAASAGTSTVNAGNGTGDVLVAGAGTDTLNAGSGGDTLYDGTGTATLNGGSGIDTFYVSNPMGGTTVNGGTGDIVYASGNTESGAVTDTINMSGGTLYVGAGADADIYGSNNTIITSGNSAVGSHNGDNNTVTEGDSSGVWLLDNGGDTVDAGTGDYVYVSGNGTGGADNTVNISGGSVDIDTNTQTDVYGAGNTITVGENDLAGAHDGDGNTVTIGDNAAFWLSASGGSTVTGSGDDYVSVSGNGTGGADNVVNVSNSEIDIDDNTQADIYGASNTVSIGANSVAGINGNSNGVTLGESTYFWVNGGTGNSVTASSYDTVTLGGGVGATIDGGGNDSYQFGSTFGATVIDNNASGGLTAANGVIGFGSGISDDDLWFKQSGNNLLIDLVGTTDQITVDNWFGGNAGAQVQEIEANGLKLDSQLASLVSAMAIYAANNSGFNPQAPGTGMPSALETTTIAASWHS